MKERLLEFLQYLEIGQNRFEKYVGLSHGYINKLSANMKLATIEKITKAYPELNTDWLMYGVGSMTKPIPQEQLDGIRDYDENFELRNEYERLKKENQRLTQKVTYLQKRVIHLQDEVIALKDKQISEKSMVAAEDSDAKVVV